MRNKLLKTFLIFCACSGITNILQAQSVQFTTQIENSAVALNQPFQVQFVLENAGNVSAFTPPSFSHFDMLQTSQSQQTSVVNNRMSQSITLTFLLQAKAIGNFTIGGASVRVNGVTMHSNPVTIEVRKNIAGNNNSNNNSANNNNIFNPPNMPPAAAVPGNSNLNNIPGLLKNGEDPQDAIKKNLFVKVDVDKTDVYVGQQITVTYKLYSRLQTSSRVTKVPAFTGFSTEDIELLNPPQATVEHINGQPYKVYTIRKTVLFPLQSGDLQLDPVEVDNTVRLFTLNRQPRQSQSQDPFDQFFNDPFFNNPFGNPDVTYHDYEYDIKSKPVTVHVKPLPAAGKPDNFTGAVGNFSITASLDKNQLSTDDAGTLKVSVTGAGNINLLNAPTINFPTEFDSYDPKVTDHFIKNAIPFSGSRSFEYVFMPKAAGDYNIPPVSFSYFDPNEEQYKTIQTDSFNLHVTQGKNYKASGADYSNLGNELLPLHVSEMRWSKNQFLLWSAWWYWLIFLLPIIIIIIWLLLRKRNRQLQSNQVLLKNKRANKIAKKRLSTAEKYLKQGNEKLFYDETSRALWGYFSHKLDIPFAELTKEKVQNKLNEKQVNGNDVSQTFTLIDECEQALYAPPGAQWHMQRTYDEAAHLITRLEAQLK